MTEESVNKDNSFDTIPKLMLYHSEHRGNSPANRQKEFGIWKSWTWFEVADEVRSLACGLSSLGFQRGDKLAGIGNNRPRLYWSMVATQVLGGIPVPLNQDSVAEEMLYVLENADVKYAIVQNQEQTDKLLEIKDRLPNLEHIVMKNLVECVTTLRIIYTTTKIFRKMEKNFIAKILIFF